MSRSSETYIMTTALHELIYLKTCCAAALSAMLPWVTFFVSFHSLLLSTVSGEGAKERTDRVLLTPWVKFLWESYRNMLELLKNNLVNLNVYSDVAKSAFKFCLNYQRRMEFRKLCDIVSYKVGTYYPAPCMRSEGSSDCSWTGLYILIMS